MSPAGRHNVETKCEEEVYLSKTGILYPHALAILFSLHLLYEDMKLNDLKRRFLLPLVKVLHRLACDLNLLNYVHHYWLDFPDVCPFSGSWDKTRTDVNIPSYFSEIPPNIFEHFCNMLLKKDVKCYPYMFKVNNRTKDFIQVRKNKA